ncbi:Arc family DNA-binding protein (plasmid) [Chromobacterium amazonense]|uniref:Arc family DNA-binding protein n=1 Tax=Chromobacterium amazonense TaxID=1382803 RepID=UPI00237D5B34|nr:Arc family DNA-binding protein [Chromobacterium amazonense]MDE1713572.1 Arc family DNA-binding protein [Chromobacterium amazonense]
MSKDIFRSQFRLPWDLYEQLKKSAEEAGRSLNAEIVFRLEASFSEQAPSQAQQAPEMRKAELLLGYEEWVGALGLAQNSKDRFQDYCQLYSVDGPNEEQIERIWGIDEIEPRYLRELALAWRRYARESKYLQTLEDPTRPQRQVLERRKAELVISYLQWCKNENCDAQSTDAIDRFCDVYNSVGLSQARWKVIDLPEVSPGYLEELVKVWIFEVPARLDPNIANNKQILEMINDYHQQQQGRLSALEGLICKLTEEIKSSRP